jgi:hypothetical protein
MATRTVYLTTTASLSVEVEVDDDLDEYEAGEDAIEKALEKAPKEVCASCSGWGKKWSFDLGPWDVLEDEKPV